MACKRSFTVEYLEDRVVPALFGVPWHDPGHLSLSLAPDGTGIASHTSELYSSLNQQQPEAQWQRTVLQAFQTWAVHANLDFGFRADGGQLFGTPGFVQGDPRFGDIRIGAHAMSPEVLAVAIPPDPSLSGTWTGDVLLNSDYTFDGNPYSLLAVMLQEAGHTLGLDNSPNPDSVMYTFYNATRTTLSAEDVSRIQALYGARAADSYEGPGGNDTLGRASAFRLPQGFKGETPLVAFGDVTTQADVDFYRFSFPDDGNDDQHDREATIRLQSAGASLLAPKLTVFDQFGRRLATRTSTSITGDVLQVKLTGLSSEQTFYVKVEAATRDVFGVGRYGLSVRLDKTSGTSDQVIDKLLRGPFDGLGPDAIDAFFRTSGDVLLNPDGGANDTRGGATPLTSSPGYAPGRRYETVASLAKKEDVDFYRLTAPTGAARVLTATVWTPDTNGFQPTITVVDATGHAVAAEVLVHGNGTSTVQVANTAPGQVYYLRVAVSTQASQDKGNYLVAASFGERDVALTTFAEGSLDQNHRETSSRLYIGQTQLFHFVLTAGGQDPGASIRLTIRDATGAVVFRVTAKSGESASGSSLLLRPGSYTATFEIDNPNGPPVTFQLAGGSTSDPIGPVTVDPTLNPQYTVPPAPAQPPYYGYPGFPVPYDPSQLPGFFDPRDPSTWPPGFVPPPEFSQYPWLIVTTNPYYWIPLAL